QAASALPLGDWSVRWPLDLYCLLAEAGVWLLCHGIAASRCYHVADRHTVTVLTQLLLHWPCAFVLPLIHLHLQRRGSTLPVYSGGQVREYPSVQARAVVLHERDALRVVVAGMVQRHAR